MSHKQMLVYAQTRNSTGGPELTGKTAHRDPCEGIMEEEKRGPGWPKYNTCRLNSGLFLVSQQTNKQANMNLGRTTGTSFVMLA